MLPNQMASLWSKYEFKSGGAKGLNLGVGVTYVGDRAGQRDSVVRSFGLPSYTVVNGLVSYVRGRQQVRAEHRESHRPALRHDRLGPSGRPGRAPQLPVSPTPGISNLRQG